MLWGQWINVYTDHKNLTWDTLGLTSNRVTRWRILLEEYALKIIYIKGIHNTVADAISQLDYDPKLNSTNEYNNANSSSGLPSRLVWGGLPLLRGGAFACVKYLDAPLSLNAIACWETKENEPGSQWIFKPVVLSRPPQDIMDCVCIFDALVFPPFTCLGQPTPCASCKHFLASNHRRRQYLPRMYPGKAEGAFSWPWMEGPYIPLDPRVLQVLLHHPTWLPLQDCAPA